jgi:hypothetical protein
VPSIDFLGAASLLHTEDHVDGPAARPADFSIERSITIPTFAVIQFYKLCLSVMSQRTLDQTA